jgi:hypothetical protein
VGDLTLGSSAGVVPVSFGEQHHVWIDDGGHLMLWDNRPDAVYDTRLLQIAVDEGAMEADIVDAWSAGEWCPGRGSAFVLPNGNALADCSVEPPKVIEIEHGTDDVLWSMAPSCDGAQPAQFLLYRAVPVDLYPHLE